jgi:hypothetical protein
MAESIINFIYIVAFSFPLIFFIKYLIKYLSVRILRKKFSKYYLKEILAFVFTLVSLFIQFLIIIVFFFPNFYIPHRLKMIGGILALIYVSALVIFSIVFMAIGRSGVSPNKILGDIINQLSKNQKDAK